MATTEALKAPMAAAGTAPLLKVRGLEAWYGESHVLHGIDFDVAPGEVVTLLGRNGAGKTTTLKSIMGVHRLSARARSCWRARRRSPCPRARSQGSASASCPRSGASTRPLSVEENLMLPPQVKPGGLLARADLHALPQPQGAAEEPGHQAFRRRAADAGDRPHPAHRRAFPAAARRADRGPRPRHHRADRPHHRETEAGGLHHHPGRTELPLRPDGGRPALCRRARQGHRHDPECRSSTPISTSCIAISASEAARSTRTAPARPVSTEGERS